uniref:YebC/PmpR family DNA-binding transcriptional regulator n=1 Tax=Salmonella enterica TaxID=28901 RepID=UPI00329A36E3
EARVTDAAIEVGADDVQVHDDGAIEIISAPENYETVRDALDKAAFKAAHSEVTWVASLQVDLNAEALEKMQRLVDMLEDLDDVQAVYHNANL